MATVRNLLIRISVSERTSNGVRRVTTQLRETNRELDRADKSAGRFRAALSRIGGISSAGLSRVGSAAQVAAKGIIAFGLAAASVQSVVQLGSAVAPLAGLLGALPAVAVGAAAAITTLKLATSGLGDAFKAASEGDPKKFAEALKNLSPAARSVATEFYRLQPALKSIKLTAQQALFQPLQGQLTAVTRVLAGPLRQGVAQVGFAFGLAGRQVAQFARQAATVRLLQTAFAATAVSVRLLTPALQPVLAGLRAIAQAGLGFLPQLAVHVSAVAQRFGAWMQQMAATGRVTVWIQNALATLRQLGTVFAQVGGIISSVLKAASAAGSGFLGVIGQALASLNAFLKTAAGQQALTAIFSGLAAIGRALSPVIQALAVALGMLAAPLGRLALQLAPILVRVIQALAPALVALEPGISALIDGLGGAIQALAPALAPLGRALAMVAVAAAPLLPVIGQLAALIAQMLAASLQNLAEALGPVITALAVSLAPLLPMLVQAFAQLAAAVLPIAGLIGQQLARAITTLMPQIINLIPPLVTQLLPAFLQWMIAMTPLIPQLVQLGIVLAENLLGALGPLLPPLTQMLILMARFTAAAMPMTLWILKVSTALAETLGGSVNVVVRAVAWLVGKVWGFFSWLFNVLVGHSIIPDLVNGVIRWFGFLPGRIVAIFAGLISGVMGKARDLVNVVWRIPGWIANIFRGAGNWLYSAGRNIMYGLMNGLWSLAGAVWNAMARIVRGIYNLFPHSPAKEGPLSGKGGMDFAGRNISNQLAAGMLARRSAVAGAATRLAGAAAVSAGTPMVGAPVAPAGGAYAAPAGVATGQGAGVVRVQLDFTGVGDDFATAIAKHVRTRAGGSVQLAFGTGAA